MAYFCSKCKRTHNQGTKTFREHRQFLRYRPRRMSAEAKKKMHETRLCRIDRPDFGLWALDRK